MIKLFFDETIASIKRGLNNSLLGVDAHQLMAPQHRFPSSYYLEREKDYRVAAVLALLFPDATNNETRIVLIERAGGNFAHAHQISFPGGKSEPEDLSLEKTALRETFEEVGVSNEAVEIIGGLSTLYIPPSKFLVHPFIGITNDTPKFVMSENEVVNVLTPLLSDFTDTRNRKVGDFESTNGMIVNAPYYDLEGKKIWGATAMMISELLTLI